MWAGKYTADQASKATTITDSENGKTVTFEIVESTPGTSMKMNIEGYGEAQLKAVTKGDLTQFAEEAEKLLTELSKAAK